MKNNLSYAPDEIMGLSYIGEKFDKFTQFKFYLNPDYPEGCFGNHVL